MAATRELGAARGGGDGGGEVATASSREAGVEASGSPAYVEPEQVWSPASLQAVFSGRSSPGHGHMVRSSLALRDRCVLSGCPACIEPPGLPDRV